MIRPIQKRRNSQLLLAFKLTIPFCFLMSFSIQAQNEEKRYELERLIRHKNHIEQILTYEFSLTKKDSVLTQHNFYNSEGNLIKRLEYDNKGRIQYKATINYTYNDRGLETRETGYDGAGNLIQKFVYIYDKNGHRTDYNQLDAAEKILTHQESIYNKKGQQIKLLTQNVELSDKPYLSVSFSYNDAGLQTGFVMYSPYGDAGSVGQYEYDSNGNLIAFYNIINNKKKLYYTNQYNSKQQLVETKFYQINHSFSNGNFNADTSDKSIKFTYDSDGNSIEKTTWSKTSLTEQIKYHFKKYDSK